MENIPDIINALRMWGVTPLTVIIVGMLYFMGAQHGMFPKFWKTNGEKRAATLADVHSEMVGLKSYFNHETTERLDKSLENQKEIKKKQEETHECVKSVVRKQDEWDRFGVKTRKS